MVLTTTDKGRVRTLAINRPDALNAMNNEVFAAIRDGLDSALDDDGVAVVVITGTGRAFCAGQDLTEMLASGDDGADGDSSESGSGERHQFPSMLKRLTTFPKPIVAAVNGLGVGIGMTFLGHCDLVLMEAEAKLRTPFPQLGLAPEAGSSWTFASVMGWQNAAHVLMTGRWFSAQECLAMGLVWKVCDGNEELMAETMAVATEIAANPIPSLVATKQLMLDAGRAEQALAAHRREMIAYRPLVGAPANEEAVAAFQEKRDPDFASIPGL
ncbi:MAG: enoyl-CoA hydratase/isomerase family protein [Actinomycetia bacterium]|nr:enoyl-CoA hydratase/isomerase family protein [Actinomycetes bacterium]